MRVEPQPDEIGFNTHNIPMADNQRHVIYKPDGHPGNDIYPGPTRYHTDFRPGVRQYIQGNPHFSEWQGFHQPKSRLPVRDYTRVNTAGAKPIRIWDASDYPASVPINTYIPNPGQLTPNPYSMNPVTVQSSAQIWRTW